MSELFFFAKNIEDVPMCLTLRMDGHHSLSHLYAYPGMIKCRSLSRKFSSY